MCHFYTLRGSEFWLVWIFAKHLLETAEMCQINKMAKMAVLELLHSHKLNWHKIWLLLPEKSWNFHILQTDLLLTAELNVIFLTNNLYTIRFLWVLVSLRCHSYLFRGSAWNWKWQHWSASLSSWIVVVEVKSRSSFGCSSSSSRLSLIKVFDTFGHLQSLAG